MPMNQIIKAYESFKVMWPEKGLDALSEFYWQNGSAYLIDEWEIGGLKGKRKEIVYRKPQSPWHLVDSWKSSTKLQAFGQKPMLQAEEPF